MNIDYSREISPNDHMLTAGEVNYFKTTDSAVRCIYNILNELSINPDSIESVLDFGSGYGRVYRALVKMFPSARFTACDLMSGAVSFCAETFGGHAVQSNEDFSVKFRSTFDLVWIGSVFTHLNREGWGDLFQLLAENTVADGVVIATIHGERALAQIEKGALKRNPHLIDKEWFEAMKTRLPEDGFAFRANEKGNYRHQVKMGMDLTEGNYGFTFVTKGWVRRYIDNLLEWDLIEYREADWGGNHDVMVLKRRAV